MNTIRFGIERLSAFFVGLVGLFLAAVGFANIFGTTTLAGYGRYATTSHQANPEAGVLGAIAVGFLALVPATIAANKGREKLIWWVYAIWLLPLALIRAAVAQPTLEAQDADAQAEGRIRCPLCAEYIRPEAVVCRWCGKDVPAQRPAVPVA